MNKKLYLGDSVYAEVDPIGGILLTTENGYGPTNTIYLEPEVLDALIQFKLQIENETPPRQ